MKSCEINIRDPFVLVHNNQYYLYGTRSSTCWGLADGFDVYVSKDMQNWSKPIEVFHNKGDFWADRNYWAPEVYYYRGAFYLFATFKSETSCRGTQILKADSPLGPFKPHTKGPITPSEWECIDGTFYVNDAGDPFMIFCHEHRQIVDGTICVMQLSVDLLEQVGEIKTLFAASEASWTKPLNKEGHYVTDGPFIYTLSNKELLMLWSSFGKYGYAQAVARNKSKDIFGEWSLCEELLFEKDGGHGMIFTGLDQKLYLTLHSPNETLKEHPVFLELEEKNDSLVIKK